MSFPNWSAWAYSAKTGFAALLAPLKFAARPGFNSIPAVRNECLHEIKSALILQPGPAALTDGLNAMVRIVEDWASGSAAKIAS